MIFNCDIFWLLEIHIFLDAKLEVLIWIIKYISNFMGITCIIYSQRLEYRSVLYHNTYHLLKVLSSQLCFRYMPGFPYENTLIYSLTVGFSHWIFSAIFSWSAVSEECFFNARRIFPAFLCGFSKLSFLWCIISVI